MLEKGVEKAVIQASRTLSRLVLVLIANAVFGSVFAQGIGKKVVILSIPEHDARVADLLFNQDSPILNRDDLKKAFPEDEYVWLDNDDEWLYLIDLEHRSQRRHRSLGALTKAILEHCDDRGVLRWGDLPEGVRESTLDLHLSSAGNGLKSMGEDAGDVRLAFRLTLVVEAEVNGKKLRVESMPGISLTTIKSVEADLEAHPAEADPFTPADVPKFRALSLKARREQYGLSARYIGVSRNFTNRATRKALDAYDDFLREMIRGQDGVYDELEARYLAHAFPEFGGKIPDDPLSMDKISEQNISLLTDRLRARMSEFGLTSEADVARAIADIRSCTYTVGFGVFFHSAKREDAEGELVSSPGYGVNLIER